MILKVGAKPVLLKVCFFLKLLLNKNGYPLPMNLCVVLRPLELLIIVRFKFRTKDSIPIPFPLFIITAQKLLLHLI